MKFIVIILVLIIGAVSVNGAGISTEFMVNDTIAVSQGESRIIQFEMVNTESLPVRVRLNLEGTLASIVDERDFYVVDNVPQLVYLNISVPERVKPGRYKVVISAIPLNMTNKSNGQALRVRKDFDVLVQGNVTGSKERFFAFGNPSLLLFVGISAAGAIYYYTKKSKRPKF